MPEEEFHQLLKTLFLEKKKIKEREIDLENASAEVSALRRTCEEQGTEIVELKLELEKLQLAGTFARSSEIKEKVESPQVKQPIACPDQTKWKREKDLIEAQFEESVQAFERKKEELKKEKERGSEERAQAEKARQQLVAKLADNLTYIQRQMETIKELKKQIIGLQRELENEKANHLALEEKYFARGKSGQ